MGRVGGWGFVAGLRYDLKADEALVVTTHNGGSRYTGFQLNDPWMIPPDARKFPPRCPPPRRRRPSRSRHRLRLPRRR